MLQDLLHALVEIGPAAMWLVGCFIGLVAVFTVYVGIAMWAMLRAQDSEQRKQYFQLVVALLELFLRRRRK